MIGNITSQTLGIPAKKVYIGQGEKALLNTLVLMKNIIQKSCENYYVRRWAEKITEGTGREDLPKLMALWDYLVGNTEYCKDIEGTETLKTPEMILKLMEMGEVPQIDCDCMTMLILSLAKSVGLPVAMRAVAIYPKTEYSHVYGLAKVKNMDGERWVSLDLTRPDLGFGWEHPMAMKVKTVRV